MPEILENLFRSRPNKDNYESINIYCQDESRFGLITKQSKVLSVVGIKPIGKYKHSYKYTWLWGSFSPITGDSHYFMSQGVSKDMFIAYLEDLSLHKPKELKILLIDNAAFHSTQNVSIPDNIILLPIPPYCPELNPAEKMWQYLKSKIAMKVYDTIEDLNDKITALINQTTKQQIQSITGYGFILNAYYSNFK